MAPNPFYPEAADINCDEGIDIVDALLLAQYYVGLITLSPCDETPAPTDVVTVAPTAVNIAAPTYKFNPPLSQRLEGGFFFIPLIHKNL